MLRFSRFDIIQKAALPIIAVSLALAAGSAAAQSAHVDFQIENYSQKAQALLLAGGPGAGCYPVARNTTYVPSSELLAGRVTYSAIAMTDSGCSPGTGMVGFAKDFQADASKSSMRIVINNSGITIM
ncbi:hypothetical protein [Xanthomonas graminis]|uniref:hypothetical protein n=1 Tax=Xanthomonas graminis TaxID=3390026 RepID=UPI000A40F1F2|nr:hypothetical protein [Xanthomonas translucens]